MHKLRIGAVLATALALSVPAALEAQGPPGERDRHPERTERRGSDRDGGAWDVIFGRRGDRERDRDRGRDRDRYEDRDDRGRAAGPPFCRNGEGHPVFGRRWCRDKGFGVGSQGGNVLEDIIFRTPRRDRRQLDERDLSDILGSVILGRLEARSGDIGVRGPLTGEWLQDSRGGDALRVLSGRLPIAELLDRDGDGAVDVLRLRRGS